MTVNNTHHSLLRVICIFTILIASLFSVLVITQENEGFRQAARGLPDDHTGPLRVVTISGEIWSQLFGLQSTILHLIVNLRYGV